LANNHFDVNPTTLPAWQELIKHASSLKKKRIEALFAEDKLRNSNFSIKQKNFFLDYSKNLITKEVLLSLLSLADQALLKDHTTAFFAGEKINTSEKKPAVHMALRGHKKDNYRSEGKPIYEQIAYSLSKVKDISSKVRNGTWLGSTGRAITDVIHIGVGGSDLGPKMACQALRTHAHESINIHFISNADGSEILATTSILDPETTLVIIASKSFSTLETILNASTTMQWLQKSLGLKNPQSSTHVIAVTASKQKAASYGIDPSRILEFEEWVGGRFSLWSSIGLSVSIYIGHDNFTDMLDGAREMDIHFNTAPYEHNLPVMLALIGIWNNNFLDAHTCAVIPYCERLSLFPEYLQQLEMESNGKSVSLNNKPLGYATSPIVWGKTGSDAQHAFFQLLHQGSHLIPVNFIGFINDKTSNKKHHDFLLGNLIAQSSALMIGRSNEELPMYQRQPGNNPSNMLLIDELTPSSFGALIALYEHKTFIQGSIWNINSFDQWGVELGKEMTENLLDTNKSLEFTDTSAQYLALYMKEHTSS
jgi:glucose-6-phosphate isomerase|tara:strand:- start:1032 stop:2639 length:1608 start_codon:yes stop_codon:yes gene_type:complete